MVNRVAVDKDKSKNTFNFKNVAKVIKHSRIFTSIQRHVGIKFSQIQVKL